MRIYYFIITLIISFCVSLQAQNNADKFKQQAQSSFENKDYTKARYLYIQAYKDYANEGKITQAIECGTQAASLYHRENYYQEAFDLCRQMSQIVANQEHAEQKKLYGLRFGITKERLQMYIKLRNTAQAQLQLNMLDNLAEESGNPELTEELLYTKRLPFPNGIVGQRIKILSNLEVQKEQVQADILQQLSNSGEELNIDG